MALHVPAGKIRDIYNHIACGGKLDAEDWAEIPSHRHAVVKREIREIHRLRDQGHNQDARTLALDYAARTLANLPDDWEPESATTEAPQEETPRTLAAKIRRRY